jgi:hypothetical protein
LLGKEKKIIRIVKNGMSFGNPMQYYGFHQKKSKKRLFFLWNNE